MSPSTAELMAQVAAVIRDHPGSHDQDWWVDLPDTHAEDVEVLRRRAYEDQPVCGTTACVGGWAAIMAAPPGSFIDRYGERITLKGEHLTTVRIEIYARQVLGLNVDQAEWLFGHRRARSAILAALAYLPSHPDASVEDLVALND